MIIWFLAILSSTPYFYLTKNIEHQCTFDENLRFYVTLCFDISATFFFVLPACILCFLYALMAQRLYSIGLLQDKAQWSRRHRLNSCSYPMDIQRIRFDDPPLRKSCRPERHTSTPTLTLIRSSVFRSDNFSSPGLTLHIQSMKKSAFKMLCKLPLSSSSFLPLHLVALIQK